LSYAYRWGRSGDMANRDRSTRRRRMARWVGSVGLVAAIAMLHGGCTTMKSIVAPPPVPTVTIPPPPPVKKEPEPPPFPKESELPQPAKKEPEAAPTAKEPPAAPVMPPVHLPPPPPTPTKTPPPPPPAKTEPEATPPARKEPEAPPMKKGSETAPPVLAPQVGKGAEEQAKRATSARIQRTEQIIGQLEGKKLTNDQREQFLTVQNLLGSAKEALAAQDLAKASNLSEKARILAEELSQSVK
jgi:hypothetical protein